MKNMDAAQVTAPLCVLAPCQWPELYRMMVAQKFPAVPPRFEEAVPSFKKARLYGLLEGSELVAGFVFGLPEDGVAFLDVVCMPRMQGRWATPGVLRALYALAFETLGLRCVWVQPHGRKALKACLQAGFVASTPLDAGEPVLVMTPHGVPRRYRITEMGKGEKRDG